MTKEELRSLTIEQLNGMTEEQLDVVANQVIELLEEDEIKQLPKEVRNKLKISREGGLITKDFAKAWQTLDAELIIKHLSPDFIYDSQWVYASLDYKGYIEYIRGKFKTIRESKSEIEVRIIHHSETGGVIAIRQDKGEPGFYVIRIKNGKVTKGDLCMFPLY